MQSGAHDFLNYKGSASDIESFMEKLVADYTRVLDEIGSLKEQELTFENTVRRMHQQDGEAVTLSARITLPAMVSVDKATRDAANSCKKRLYDYWSGIYSTREDVYKNLKSVDAKLKEGTPGSDQLSDEDKRLLQRTLKLFERNGLSLDKETRAKIVELREEISNLSNTFERRVNEDVTTVSFTTEELDGCDTDFINSLKKIEVDGVQKHLISMKAPEYVPVIRKAKNPHTRKALLIARDSRCLDNAEVLEKVISLKHQVAQLMGYDTHAQYQLEVKMARTPKAVTDFLNHIIAKIDEKCQKDTEVLLALKKADMEAQGLEFSGCLDLWDYTYYERILEETKYHVDEEIVKEYFPLDYVVTQILDLYMHLLDLQFQELTDEKSREGIWHDEVKLYEARDKTSNEVIGHFYLDIFPRDGKYSHQCVYPLQPSYVKKDGSRQHPTAAFLGNLTRATATRPSLLRSSEVLTFFHEFGHIMHCLCTKSTCPLFSWAWTVVPWLGGVEQDFLEVPSQMLENWIWEPEVLQKLSGHYTDTSKKLPEELAKKVVALKNVNISISKNRLCFMSLLDIVMHNGMVFDENNRLVDLWAKMRKEITKTELIPGTNPACSWYHPIMGYDAGYYGYLWSEVFSSDMYHTVFASKKGDQGKVKGFFDPVKGLHYRKTICEPGATKDGIDMLKAFLGREPNSEAFFKDILSD